MGRKRASAVSIVSEMAQLLTCAVLLSAMAIFRNCDEIH